MMKTVNKLCSAEKKATHRVNGKKLSEIEGRQWSLKGWFTASEAQSRSFSDYWGGTDRAGTLWRITVSSMSTKDEAEGGRRTPFS